MNLWTRLNIFFRPLLPLLHLFMFAVTGAVLFSTVFANQHLPCWSDEIFMIDPAYYRVTTGVWKSRVAWDSFSTVPYAPNYPLFINLLRGPISLFGVNYRMLRGLMLLLGLAPVAFLLWFFLKKGLFQSKLEILWAAFSCACFTAFYCTVYVRPEALLLCVVAMLLYSWISNSIILLFLSALLIPLCGIQWNVLLLPVALHWLVFGGQLRKPLVVAVAFILSSIATLAAYHALGMWPSYLQEVARVGGLDAISHAIAKLHGAFAKRDWLFLTNSLFPYDALPADFIFLSGALVVFWKGANCRLRKIWFFSFASYYGVILSIAFLGSLNCQYPKVLLLAPAFAVPALFRDAWKKYPVLLFVFSGVFAYIALVHWHKLSDDANHLSDVATDVSSSASWVSETALEQALDGWLKPDDVVCCESPAYFAVRSRAREMMPLVFAFDISPEEAREITAVLLQDEPYRVFDRDRAEFRKTSFAGKLQALFWLPNPPIDIDLWEFEITPDNLLAAIAASWHCSFIELPLPPWPSNTIHFRMFRPVFPTLQRIPATGLEAELLSIPLSFENMS